MPSSKKSAGSPASSKTDAIKLLTDDHKAVKALFKEYDKLAEAEAGADQRREMAQRICRMLTIHTTLEEELFYPTAREALEEQDEAGLVDEATVEHGSAKQLIQQIEDGDPDEPLYDAQVKVLGEYIDHHVKEEEGEMFPKLKKTELDLGILGEQLAGRKEELQSEEEAERA